MDFLVLPLTPATVPAIEKAIVLKVAFKGYTVGFQHHQLYSGPGADIVMESISPVTAARRPIPTPPRSGVVLFFPASRVPPLFVDQPLQRP
jgi:hypothetical protein